MPFHAKKKKINRTECKSKTEKGERKFRSCFILYTITAYYCSFLCVFFVFVQFCCFSFCCCCYQCGRCRDTHLRFFQFFSPFFHLRRGKAVQRRMEKTTATLKKKRRGNQLVKKKKLTFIIWLDKKIDFGRKGQRREREERRKADSHVKTSKGTVTRQLLLSPPS